MKIISISIFTSILILAIYFVSSCIGRKCHQCIEVKKETRWGNCSTTGKATYDCPTSVSGVEGRCLFISGMITDGPIIVKDCASPDTPDGCVNLPRLEYVNPNGIYSLSSAKRCTCKSDGCNLVVPEEVQNSAAGKSTTMSILNFCLLESFLIFHGFLFYYMTATGHSW